MKISVIIPVYNAERFVEQAILSVVKQPQVDEILVIDDCSKDNSGQLVANLQQKHPHIRLIKSNEHTNVGAGAARNIGIQAASNKWIAFLDVDDYYLDNRFDTAVQVISQHPDADGIYEAVDNQFENEQAYTRFLQSRPAHIAQNKADYRHTLFTIYETLPPDKLFEALMQGDKGFFHFNGLTVKKSLLMKVGLLNEQLELTQDIDLFNKLAMIGRLYPGNLKTPVAVRLVHDTNRVYGNDEKLKFFQVLSYLELVRFAKAKKCRPEIVQHIHVRNCIVCASQFLGWNIYRFYRLKLFVIRLIYPIVFKQYLTTHKTKFLRVPKT